MESTRLKTLRSDTGLTIPVESAQSHVQILPSAPIHPGFAIADTHAFQIRHRVRTLLIRRNASSHNPSSPLLHWRMARSGHVSHRPFKHCSPNKTKEHVTWGSVIAVLSAGLFLVVTASYVSELDLAARYHWDPNGDTFVNTTRNLLFAAAASLVGLAGGILGVFTNFQERNTIPKES